MGHFHEDRGRRHGPALQPEIWEALRAQGTTPPGGWAPGVTPPGTPTTTAETGTPAPDPSPEPPPTNP